ncbi:MAG: IS6 family transposase ISSto2 [Metallosphaera javensis (ex Sakai et al. 2022)]|nr:MAG: IS6 family transposase ISSto2 [Metallosphaera javensis (ex Sakai et al. 2022)]
MGQDGLILGESVKIASLPVLTQIMCYLLRVNNLEPRFHSLEEVARALAGYYLGHSLRRFRLPRSTVHYYWRRLSSARVDVPVSGEYAVDETKVILVKGVVYYLWVVRDLNTGVIPFFMVTEARSGLDVLILVGGVREVELRVRGEVLKARYVHDGLPAYNFLSMAGVEHEHITFGVRNRVEQVFRTVKHRLSGMDFHFPWNSSKWSLRKWFSTYFTVYNLLQLWQVR